MLIIANLTILTHILSLFLFVLLAVPWITDKNGKDEFKYGMIYVFILASWLLPLAGDAFVLNRSIGNDNFFSEKNACEYRHLISLINLASHAFSTLFAVWFTYSYINLRKYYLVVSFYVSIIFMIAFAFSFTQYTKYELTTPNMSNFTSNQSNHKDCTVVKPSEDYNSTFQETYNYISIIAPLSFQIIYAHYVRPYLITYWLDEIKRSTSKKCINLFMNVIGNTFYGVCMIWLTTNFHRLISDFKDKKEFNDSIVTIISSFYGFSNVVLQICLLLHKQYSIVRTGSNIEFETYQNYSITNSKPVKKLCDHLDKSSQMETVFDQEVFSNRLDDSKPTKSSILTDKKY